MGTQKTLALSAVSYAYDTGGRLAGVTHAKSGTTLASVAYTLDDAGNRLTETTAGVPLAGTTTYGYDATDRLTSAAYPGGGSGGWGYDNVGNSTSVSTNGTATYAAYDDANRLCWDNGASANTCATPTSGATTYTYDGDGYRTKKVVGATTTVYAWDRLGLGGLGTVIAAGTAEFVHGPAGLQQRTVGTASDYAHGDGLGSLRLITNASGAASGSATYEPWGAPRGGSASLGGFGYTGELTDAETGFVYLRARYLDPATGRFTTEDSFGGSLGSPVSQQRFAYGNDNPTNYTDPSGQFAIVAGVVALFAAAGIAITAAAAVEIIAVFGVFIVGTALIQCFRLGPCLGWVQALAGQVVAGYLRACAFAGSLHQQWQQGWTALATPSQYQVSQNSSTHNWGDYAELEDHFDRHGREVGAKTSTEYEEMAGKFYEEAKAQADKPRYKVKVDDGGVVRIYDSATGRFASYNADGTIKTFQKADDAYWRRQPGRDIPAPP